MIQDSSNKEFSLKNGLSPEVKKPSEQISDIPEIPEQAPKETIQPKEQKEKTEIKITGKKEQSYIQKAKEKVHISGKAGATTTQPSEEVQFEIKNIESILQEGLEETYRAMDPVSRAQFKTQGEDTAKAINILLHKTKIKIKEIVNLIVKWLKLIPGVNKFFIEQEAKIKADKLMSEKRRKDRENYEQK